MNVHRPDMAGPAPGPASWGYPPQPPPRPHRFKSAAALLAVFLGDFGAHNFYLSQVSRGVLHVLLVGVGVAVFLYGQDVSLRLPDAAGIPAGILWHLGGLAVLAANGVWRWVELAIIMSTPEYTLGREARP